MLRFLRDENFSHVAAVVWNVIPNVRRDAPFSRHACFIDRLGHGVWSCVVVVCKQSMRPERDGGGALAAAREVRGEEREGRLQVTGYRFLSDFDDDEDQRARMEADENNRWNQHNMGVCAAAITRIFLTSLQKGLQCPH